jgi:hypothetical protein
MTKLVVAIAVALTLAVIAVIAYMWESLSDVAMSTAGYLALVGGGVLTFALGIGLMFLIFYSNRAGFDDQARLQVSNDKDMGQRQAGKG